LWLSLFDPVVCGCVFLVWSGLDRTEVLGLSQRKWTTALVSSWLGHVVLGPVIVRSAGLDCSIANGQPGILAKSHPGKAQMLWPLNEWHVVAGICSHVGQATDCCRGSGFSVKSWLKTGPNQIQFNLVNFRLALNFS